MELVEVYTKFIGFLIPIIGFFVKKTLDDVKRLKDMSYGLQKDLEVLKIDHLNKYTRLEEKFDDLFDAVKDLTLEIKNLNNQLSKKKDI